jgi:pyruvate dehydrogenase E2 component (dihydrolipoamide acetyltransferase)
MPAEITMPQLSDTMTEGTVVKWLKKEGDKVKSGDIIAEIETDKANMEMEAFESGTLALMAAKEGEKVKVGGRIAVLATGDENPQAIKQQFAAAPQKDATASKAPAQGGAQNASKSETEMGTAPLERGRAQSRQEQTATGPGKTSESLARDARTAVAARPNRPSDGNGGRMKVSPLARRLAEERGVNLHEVTGTGPGGRITKDDIEAALDAPAIAPAAKPAVTANAPAKAPGSAVGLSLAPRVASGQKEVIPLTKMRATIAQRLQQSKQQIPHFYSTVEADVEQIAQMRQRLNKQLEAEEVRLSLGDFVAKAVAQACLIHPQVNAHLVANEITRFGDVHLGMAVALPDGLIVPVLRNINQMGLREIRQRSNDLAERARAGRLKQDEMTGATFTVSNLGMYGVRDFSAIINPPEVCILAVSAAEKRPVVRDNEIVPRTVMSLTLSADHRAVDGATAAEFLRTLKGLLEEPGMMLV